MLLASNSQPWKWTLRHQLLRPWAVQTSTIIRCDPVAMPLLTPKWQPMKSTPSTVLPWA